MRGNFVANLAAQYRGKGFKGYGLMHVQRREFAKAAECFKKSGSFFRERASLEKHALIQTCPLILRSCFLPCLFLTHSLTRSLVLVSL